MDVTDDVLLEELKKRFLYNKKALHELQVMNEKIEKLNKKLTESEQLKTNFLSNIRNEINNPLTSILGMARELAGPARDEKTRQAMAQTIYEEAFELDFQLRNIFVAAELEAGEASISCVQVDIRELTSRAIASFRHKAEQKHVSVEFDAADGEGGRMVFPTDPEKLQRVIANLLANAIEYNIPGGKVRIEARKENKSLLVSIADQGIGIPEQERERLFERFHQLDQGPSKKHKGHGLGLSVTKALVDLLGGKVSVSPSEGGGCLFRVSVPETPATDADPFAEDGSEFLSEGGSTF